MDTPPSPPTAPSFGNPGLSFLDPVKLLWALGDQVRWQIVRELADGSALTVVELAARLKRKANLISKHLRPLREAGAVRLRESPGQDGRKSFYEAPPFTRAGAAPGARVVDYGYCLLRF